MCLKSRQENTCAGAPISTDAGWSWRLEPRDFIKKKLRHWCFAVKFVQFLRLFLLLFSQVPFSTISGSHVKSCKTVKISDSVNLLMLICLRNTAKFQREMFVRMEQQVGLLFSKIWFSSCIIFSA